MQDPEDQSPDARYAEEERRSFAEQTKISSIWVGCALGACVLYYYVGWIPALVVLVLTGVGCLSWLVLGLRNDIRNRRRWRQARTRRQRNVSP